MNSKQLANVLIKILGLSICVHGIPTLIVGLIYVTELPFFGGLANGVRSNLYMGSTQIIMGLVPFAIGIYLVIRSRWLTDKLFKDE